LLPITDVEKIKSDLTGNTTDGIFTSIEKVTKKELLEFLDSIPEDASGKKPSMSWVRNQKKYIKYKVQEDEANYFTLTPLGKRVLKSSRINETNK
jgi:hypothetical protein